MAGAVIHRQKARREAFFVVLGGLLRAVHRPGWLCDSLPQIGGEGHRTKPYLSVNAVLSTGGGRRPFRRGRALSRTYWSL